MTFPGVPSVYYGDEAGLEDIKTLLTAVPIHGQENTELLAWHKKIIALRNQYDVFKTGKWISLNGHEQVYAYIRTIRNGQDVFGKTRENQYSCHTLKSESFSNYLAAIPAALVLWYGA